jgi:hypothetical protein
MIPDITPELKELITNIGNRTGYNGQKIPESIMKMFEIENTDKNAGILVPYWLGVLQKGRGPRKSNKDYGLVKIIFLWMQKHNLFRSKIPAGQLNEAKSVTWYINKYGNKHFRSKAFIDVYKTEREKTIKKIDEKYGKAISKITMDVI